MLPDPLAVITIPERNATRARWLEIRWSRADRHEYRLIGGPLDGLTARTQYEPKPSHSMAYVCCSPGPLTVANYRCIDDPAVWQFIGFSRPGERPVDPLPPKTGAPCQRSVVRR
ncbi:MAG: hypothetical protein U0575_07435 [Phycisphaerales bacterium]